MGTPKTLNEALENGLSEILELKKSYPCLPINIQAQVLKKHVADFLAQAFNAAVLGAADNDREESRLMDLFYRVSGRDRAA